MTPSWNNQIKMIDHPEDVRAQELIQMALSVLSKSLPQSTSIRATMIIYLRWLEAHRVKPSKFSNHWGNTTIQWVQSLKARGITEDDVILRTRQWKADQMEKYGPDCFGLVDGRSPPGSKEIRAGFATKIGHEPPMEKRDELLMFKTNSERFDRREGRGKGTDVTSKRDDRPLSGNSDFRNETAFSKWKMTDAFEQPPPKHYICNRCNQKGHHLQMCPTNLNPAYDKPPDINYMCEICNSWGVHFKALCPENRDPYSILQRRKALGILPTKSSSQVLNEWEHDTKQREARRNFGGRERGRLNGTRSRSASPRERRERLPRRIRSPMRDEDPNAVVRRARCAEPINPDEVSLADYPITRLGSSKSIETTNEMLQMIDAHKTRLCCEELLDLEELIRDSIARADSGTNHKGPRNGESESVPTPGDASSSAPTGYAQHAKSRKLEERHEAKMQKEHKAGLDRDVGQLVLSSDVGKNADLQVPDSDQAINCYNCTEQGHGKEDCQNRLRSRRASGRQEFYRCPSCHKPVNRKHACCDLKQEVDIGVERVTDTNETRSDVSDAGNRRNEFLEKKADMDPAWLYNYETTMVDLDVRHEDLEKLENEDVAPAQSSSASSGPANIYQEESPDPMNLDTDIETETLNETEVQPIPIKEYSEVVQDLIRRRPEMSEIVNVMLRRPRTNMWKFKAARNVRKEPYPSLSTREYGITTEKAFHNRHPMTLQFDGACDNRESEDTRSTPQRNITSMGKGAIEKVKDIVTHSPRDHLSKSGSPLRPSVVQRSSSLFTIIKRKVSSKTTDTDLVTRASVNTLNIDRTTSHESLDSMRVNPASSALNLTEENIERLMPKNDYPVSIQSHGSLNVNTPGGATLPRKIEHLAPDTDSYGKMAHRQDGQGPPRTPDASQPSTPQSATFEAMDFSYDSDLSKQRQADGRTNPSGKYRNEAQYRKEVLGFDLASALAQEPEASKETQLGLKQAMKHKTSKVDGTSSPNKDVTPRKDNGKRMSMFGDGRLSKRTGIRDDLNKFAGHFKSKHFDDTGLPRS